MIVPTALVQLFMGTLGNGEEADAFETEFLQDITENKNLIFQAVIVSGFLKLAKMPGGMETLRALGKEAIHGLFNMLDSSAQASAANPVAAWANPMLISGVLERFGMLPPRFNRGFHLGISRISGVDLAGSIIETIFGAKGAFPGQLMFAKEAGAAGAAGAGAGAAAGGAAMPPMI